MELDEQTLTEHDKEMIKVAEGGDPNDPSEVNLPSEEGDKDFDLPEGFESVEDMVKWYNDLDADEEGEESDEDEGTEEGDEEDADDQDDADEDEGLSEAEAELRELKAYQAVGGAEKYAEMVDYAKQNLTPEQIGIYDQAVNGVDSNVAMLAVQGLQAMHQLNQMQNFGQEGEMTHPASGGLNVAQGYETRSDMMADMADPRYQTDESFVNRVMQKMAISNF